jgi:hypothetical protein
MYCAEGLQIAEKKGRVHPYLGAVLRRQAAVAALALDLQIDGDIALECPTQQDALSLARWLELLPADKHQALQSWRGRRDACA